MGTRRRVIVPRGMAHVATEPVVISTTVGREFAVALQTNAEPRRGGLVNLVVSESRTPDADGETTPERLLRFLRDVRTTAAEVELSAAVVGGGDTLAMMPTARWLEWSTRAAELLADAIHVTGTRIVRREVGGRLPRVVTLDLYAGTIDVEPAGREEPAPRPEQRPPLPSIVEPDPRDFSVDIGAARVDHSPNRLVAILGSCVGIALYDPVTRIGGLVHAVMPKHPDGDSDPMRYTDSAVPALLAQMQSHGANRSKVVAKIAGGAHTLPFAGPRSCFTLPDDNVRRAREALARADVPLLAQHVGGRNGRRIVVDLRTFRVSVAWLDGGDDASGSGGPG